MNDKTKHTKLIEADNLTKIYGKQAAATPAVRDASLVIEAGETVAIVGKSGSGKSTLMHLLALLDTPTSGKLQYRGEDVSRMSQKQKNKLRNQEFGFIFQQFFMDGNDTVFDNVSLPLEIDGKKSKERKKLIEEVLAKVDLSAKIRAKSLGLSGGQKQRVCIARAIINQPEIIFADEPTGNLDSVTSEKIIELLFELNRNNGTTLVIVTHDEDLAAKCARQIKISDGKIIANAIGEASNENI